MRACVCVCAYVRACVRACVRMCVRAYVRACVRVANGPDFPTQVIVNDVHIRYEDTDADPSRPFAIGLMLERMSAQSTDEDWVGSDVAN